MEAEGKPDRPRAGRPTQAEAARLTERLRQVAAETFLEHGYERTTMEAVAQAAGITKRTLYARYPDKRALFLAVVPWALTRQEHDEQASGPMPDGLAAGLTAIARSTLARAVDPGVVRLSRMALAESGRFPEFAASAHSLAWSPRLRTVMDLLRRHLAEGTIIVEDVELTAEHFLAMVAAIPARMALFGVFRAPEVEERHLKHAVTLFLNGVLARQGPDSAEREEATQLPDEYSRRSSTPCNDGSPVDRWSPHPCSTIDDRREPAQMTETAQTTETNVSKVAVVTGGASGIGRAIALRLARDGAQVAVLDLNPADAKAVADEIHAEGGEALAVEVDVSDRQNIDRGLAQVRDRFGPVTVLVNSAGKDGFKRFLSITEESWNKILAVNLTGTFHCCQAVVPDMVDAGWGRIVNISSSSAHSGQPLMTHYVASKAGVIGFTKALALELGPSGITVNTIPPGFIDTPMTRRNEERGYFGEGVDFHAARTPVRRVGTPEDIAAACAFLVSDEASYITGQVIGVNGGRNT